ncbi:MAG: peptidoglycan recognition protein family protein [Clostridiales bacterium]|nr:peptidoglycan recognition protein family protein [Clostridiales bacterium]
MSYHKRKRGAGAGQILYDMRHVLVGVLCLIMILLLIVAVTRHRTSASVRTVTEISEESIEAHTPDYEVDLLTINEYSRPGIALEEVNGIVIHYTANPGTSAEANRDYFEGLKDSRATKASAHFIVGLEGEIVQCIPTAEIAYASNERNSDTLSIECCYENEDGSFNQATYDSVVHLTAWLCAKFGLTSDDVMRHYDITGKLCPVYYVENPDAWEQFLADVDAYLASM